MGGAVSGAGLQDLDRGTVPGRRSQPSASGKTQQVDQHRPRGSPAALLPRRTEPMVVLPPFLRIAQHHERYSVHMNRPDITGVNDPDRSGGSRGAM